jgi:transcriptional regulator with GAF, ATPase, and Fis domain
MSAKNRETNIMITDQTAQKLTYPAYFSDILTNNDEMHSILGYIESIAATAQPILITGETGVGKELIAKSIHACSRRKGPMVTVNAAGLDDTIFSDTLFGHTKGAFTGADRNRPGLIEKADSGTLFLDEIGDLSLSSQVKLLRLLQEGEFLPLGCDELRHTNARIIAATNVDLWERQRSGNFRQDLNFRLRTHHIDIPPLRKRIDDIPILVDYFLQKAALALDKKKPAFPKELLSLLSTYSFPGNIRELESIIFDAVSRHTGRILSLERLNNHITERRADIQKINHSQTSEGQLPVTFSDELPTIKFATRLLVEEALKRAKGNQTIAAGMLGITRQALGKRLRSIKQHPNETFSVQS